VVQIGDGALAQVDHAQSFGVVSAIDARYLVAEVAREL
jgi:hypothetical protein